MYGRPGMPSSYPIGGRQTGGKLLSGRSAVTGHFSHPHSRPWKHVDAPLTPLLAKVLGAQEDEVAHTSTLTSNMHNLFTAFYRPSKQRWRIVIEKGSFPSDWVRLASSYNLTVEG